MGAVLALAQTSDGFLWLGTASGLLRFDGSVLERYRPEVGSLPQAELGQRASGNIRRRFVDRLLNRWS